jgi:hypothetical protein
MGLPHVYRNSKENMKTIIKAILATSLVVVLLASCNDSTSTPPTSSANAFEVTPSASYTNFFATPFPTGTPTPATTQSGAMPGASFTVVPAAPDEQVYVDPEGWYSVNLPADMRPGRNTPNSFVGEGRILETGYLPYMSRPIDLCLWLANVVAKPEESAVHWMSPCSVQARENGYIVEYTIYENPSADLEHRFIYVKMGRSFPSIGGYVKHTVTWLKTAAETTAGTTSLSPEEATFWENPETVLSDASIMEYALPPEGQVEPTQDSLWRFVPEEMQPWKALQKAASLATKEPTAEEQLKPLGYELKVVETQPDYRQQLLRDGRLLFDYVFNVSKVYKFSTDSGPINAFVVNKLGTNYDGYYDSFLVVNDAIYSWDYASVDTANFAPILYQGDLLWAKGVKDAGVEIRRSNRQVLFTFRTYFATHLEVNSFQAWNDHWVLTAGDFVIQDGEILNQKLGFQEMFAWRVIKDKPLYLFRKGARLGLSYNGKFLLLPYEDIPRGLCCGLAANNPGMIADSMYFFGKREGVWYYVMVRFR